MNYNIKLLGTAALAFTLGAAIFGVTGAFASGLSDGAKQAIIDGDQTALVQILESEDSRKSSKMLEKLNSGELNIDDMQEKQAKMAAAKAELEAAIINNDQDAFVEAVTLRMEEKKAMMVERAEEHGKDISKFEDKFDAEEFEAKAIEKFQAAVESYNETGEVELGHGHKHGKKFMRGMNKGMDKVEVTAETTQA